MNIDDVLAQVRPKTSVVKVCLRGDLLSQHRELEAELAAARREAPRIAQLIRDLEDQMDAESVEFTFTAIGQRAWTNLIAEHPSEDPNYMFDRVTFPIAAVAASCSEPKISPEKAEALFNVLNVEQWGTLWAACWDANVEGVSIPFSAAASVVLGGSAMKSDSPTTTVNHAASSWVG